MIEGRTGAVTGKGAPEGVAVLLEDGFDLPLPPGSVIGSRSTSGARRLGIDREGTLSIDNGKLRMRWMAQGGWGRTSLSYGPFEEMNGLLLVVRTLNGLTTSQTDPRPEGGRAMLRRWLATFPRPSIRRPLLRDNMMIGWFLDPTPRRAPTPVAAVVHRAGEDATGELWFHAGAQRVRLAGGLQNLPATYAIALQDGVASLYAWSYPRAHAFAEPDDARPIAQLALEESSATQVYAGIHQPILGEVRYRVDTRVDHVRVVRADEPSTAVPQLIGPAWWEPGVGATVITDQFAGPTGDLQGSLTSGGAQPWSRVLGDGVIERSGGGRARVRGTLTDPIPGRTVYCVPWHEPTGAEVSAVIIPPALAEARATRAAAGSWCGRTKATTS